MLTISINLHSNVIPIVTCITISSLHRSTNSHINREIQNLITIPLTYFFYFIASYFIPKPLFLQSLF